MSRDRVSIPRYDIIKELLTLLQPGDGLLM